MYIKFCINKIKLRDLEIHIAEYNDTYNKKYYVLYKIPFYFFLAEIVLVLIDQNFINSIYLSMNAVQNVITLVMHL